MLDRPEICLEPSSCLYRQINWGIKGINTIWWGPSRHNCEHLHWKHWCKAAMQASASYFRCFSYTAAAVAPGLLHCTVLWSLHIKTFLSFRTACWGGDFFRPHAASVLSVSERRKERRGNRPQRGSWLVAAAAVASTSALDSWPFMCTCAHMYFVSGCVGPSHGKSSATRWPNNCS